MSEIQQRIHSLLEKIETGFSGLSMILQIPEQTLRAWADGRNRSIMPSTGHEARIVAAEVAMGWLWAEDKHTLVDEARWAEWRKNHGNRLVRNR